MTPYRLSQARPSPSPFAWYSDDQPQSQVGLLCTATNGNVYFFTFGLSPPDWSPAATGIRGAVEVAAETNISPFVARGETGLIEGYAAIKEHYTRVNFNVPDMRAVGPFTVVNPYARTQDGYAIVLRQSDTGLGPTSFGTRR